jgi:hypothetical protein
VQESRLPFPAARLVLKAIEIDKDCVLAVVSQPDFAPLLVKRAMDEGMLKKYDNGATEVTLSNEGVKGWKQWGSES